MVMRDTEYGFFDVNGIFHLTVEGTSKLCHENLDRIRSQPNPKPPSRGRVGKSRRKSN
jgi:hypothetical protein